MGDGGTIDGVGTTEFVLIYDPLKLLGSGGVEGRLRDVEMRVWVGEDDLPRKLTMDSDTFVDEIRWTKWGEPVTISAPALDQITEDEASREFLSE